ncbi:MAG: hypothetical protein JNK76_16585 [Planctomycetales bacterium]|nr:hypothetical protein [Planctomycetales bacterium]MBN8625801.1 hypothetical protein [Planctomycetota bacterium]
MDDDRGLVVLTEALRTGKPTDVHLAIDCLNESRREYFSKKETSRARLVLGHPPLVARLLAKIDDPDLDVVRRAVETCGNLELPGSTERILQNLDRMALKDQQRALVWLAKSTTNLLIFERGMAILAKGSIESDYTLVSFLKPYAMSDDTEVRRRARDELRRFLNDNPDDGQTGYSSTRLTPLELLAQSARSEDAEMLREIVRQEKGLYKQPALEALFRLKVPDAKTQLLNCIENEDGRRAAIYAIERALKNHHDAEISAALVKAATTAEGRELADISRALWALGDSRSRAAVMSWKGRLEPEIVATFQAQAENPSVEEICRRAQAAGVITVAQASKVQRTYADSAPSDDCDAQTAALEGVLGCAELMVMFDAETGMFPNRHDELLADFAAASDGEFVPEAASETALQEHDEDFDCEYLLRFIAGGRLYTGRLRSFGDWYDVERTVEMINRAVADSGAVRRFVGVATGGQIAAFVFADPEKLIPLAAELHMPLLDDVNDAMEKGQAFERQVLEGLNDDMDEVSDDE